MLLLFVLNVPERKRYKINKAAFDKKLSIILEVTRPDAARDDTVNFD